jgi:hypothetical protein
VGRARREAQGPRAGPRPRRRATYNRTDGGRQLFAAFDLTTKKCRHVADWTAASNVEVAYTPTNCSWLNRIVAQFTAPRYFALDGIDHRRQSQPAVLVLMRGASRDTARNPTL